MIKFYTAVQTQYSWKIEAIIMNDAFGKVIAVLICAYLMFLAPLEYMNKERMRLQQSYLLNEVTYFVENVMNTGIITSDQYQEFANKVFLISEGYTIELAHSKHEYYEGEYRLLVSNNYNADIFEALEDAGIYYLNEKEYIKVSINANDIPLVFYGGGIKYEAY